jgi:hypothetical protein
MASKCGRCPRLFINANQVMNILVARSGRHIWQRPLPRLSQLKCDLLTCPRRQASNIAARDGPDVKKTRNIGIIAHIDAVCQYLFNQMIVYTAKYTSRAKLRRQSACSIIVATPGELEVTSRSPIHMTPFPEFFSFFRCR